MEFIQLDIQELVGLLDKLDPAAHPAWGNLTAQQMVEHLSDMLKVSSGKVQLPMEIPADKIEKMQAFLISDKPMAKNIEVPFVAKNPELRHEEIELAIDEFLLEWLDFEEHFQTNPERTEQHPYYGDLNYELWCRLHQKHFTHHFEQFGLLG